MITANFQLPVVSQTFIMLCCDDVTTVLPHKRFDLSSCGWGLPLFVLWLQMILHSFDIISLYI